MENASNTDDFKWFGEGFDGFPKKLPEDTVEYSIFMIDNKVDVPLKLTHLRKVLQETNVYTKDLLKDYIWQRDPFRLELKFDDGFWSLHGSTNFGDSIADEWLIVYILLEISKKNTELWIQVYDNDGEFLLIEAANALPKWLKPENSRNRVWIHAGEIRIIPAKPQTSLATGSPSFQQAISFIETTQNQLYRSVALESEAFYRINKYPKAIPEQFHESLVRLPRKVAYILHQKAAYISPAIEAFYLRDPISMKPIFSLDKVALFFPPEDFVTTGVRFTRVGYAQLKSQDFPPSGPWIETMEKTASDDVSKIELGMKLTCGFEMLVSDKIHQDKRVVREIKLILEDLENGDDALPLDSEIAKWSKKDEKDDWMNIDFNDFARELAGKEGKSRDTGEGFGDKTAEESLKKMVSRFEDFLKDDDAGLEGAEMGDTDSDDNTDTGEDEDISFDEEEFTRKMREMIGLPTEDSRPTNIQGQRIVEESELSDDGMDIRQNMNSIEAELKAAGVLDLDVAPKKSSISKGKARAITDGITEHDASKQLVTAEEEDEDEDEEVNIDFALAKNLLEAFKSQGGMAGPAGNLMGLMGVRLPPDKDDK
jgi:hypothetical protein